MVEKKRKLTLKQGKFINEVMKTGNATEAVVRTYNVKDRIVAKSMWSENLAKPYIAKEIHNRVQRAKDIIYELAEWSEKDEVRIRAAQDIIDRVEWKATQTIKQTNFNKDVNSMTDEELLEMIK